MINLMNEQHDKLLNLFVHRLRDRLGDHLKRVVLFGSRARGDAVPESDYDCLAVLDVVSPDITDAIDEIAGDFLYKHSIVFSVIPVSEERHAHQIHNPFFMNIRKEGILL